MFNNKWSIRFLMLAKTISEWSKDPSTKVGAVIVDDKRRVVGHGYNGFPRGVEDAPELYKEKEQKYERVVHAELNAILNSRGSVEGCTLFVFPLPPCPECAKAIIQSGIARVVLLEFPEGSSSWVERFKVSNEMFEQAGVKVEVCLKAG